jgi:hypothetical protein
MNLFHKKNKELELELPPPPPPDYDDDYIKSKKIDFPKIEDNKKLEEMPSFKRDMELPPMPPPEFNNFEISTKKNNFSKIEDNKKLEEMPSFKRDMELPPMPPIPDLKEFEDDLPPVPDLDELEDDLPPLREIGLKEFPKPEFTKIKEDRAELIQEKKRVTGPIFVNVSSYRDAINCINTIKNKIKESEDCLQKLDEIKNSKDKYFEQFRSRLEDLQRKSLYVDKSLFERNAFEK